MLPAFPPDYRAVQASWLPVSLFLSARDPLRTTRVQLGLEPSGLFGVHMKGGRGGETDARSYV